MKFAINSINQKIARKVYLNYLVKSLIAPFVISIVYVICALIISKYFFDKLPGWYWFVLGLPVIALFYYTYLGSRKLFFSQQELSAYIDYKTSSEGMYLTAFELDAKLEDKLQKELLLKTSTLLPLTTPWRFIVSYMSLILLFFLIVKMLPMTFLKTKSDAGELLAIEKAMLEDLKNAKVLEPTVAEELQKELDKLKEDFKKNGINKENWEKKQAIGQKLDEKLLEQQKIQEKMASQLEQLEKKIAASEKSEELAKELHSLESTLALNEFAKQSEEFQKAEKEIQELLSNKNLSNGSKLDLNQKLKLLEAMKKITKEMQNQQNFRKDCNICKEGEGQDGNKEGEANLAGKLSELAKRLDEEAKECLAECEGEGDGASGRPGPGGGHSKLELSNQVDPGLTPLNLEQFNKGGQFNSDGNVIDVSKGKHDKYTIDTQKNDQREFQNTGTDLVNEQKVNPNRREVIKKYFKRQSTQEK